MYEGILGLIKEIKKCEEVGATTAAIAMTYICIDTMALLALPVEQESHTREDFITWVDTYLKAEPEQVYQYRGLDVYGARCAFLHAFGSEVNFHLNNLDAKIFGYHDGGKHAVDHHVLDRLVLIGTASFFDDVVRAVGTFLTACQTDHTLNMRVVSRIPNLLKIFPIEIKNH